jgi:Zn-dependent protease
MGLTQLLVNNPLLFLAAAVLLLYSVIAHEIAHGFVALLFGDDTALRYGRLSLNPLSHLDPIGTLMLFVVGFGWAKPVPVNYQALDSRFGLIAVSLAGCLTNFLLAFTAIFLLQLPGVNSLPSLAAVLAIVARINVILGVFNLLPIPPLDGSKVLTAFLPWEAQESLSRIEPYGFFILILLLVTGLLNPVITIMQNGVYGLAGLLVGLVR